ncbi:trihelix transcription factor DF1 isoform X2 [Lactuca sativa]|uniref:trihelix transcription factor DF1 isoform X2 n=1 Tax=Lactuca sativa TaxID=4236 RepID=UPI000CD8C080|nr:trihelix transcription factor DF1 isoform X2 [Lactuca sativa]
MMLQGVSPGIGNSGEAAATAVSVQPNETAAASAELASGGGGGGFSEDERGRIEEGGRNSGGNRWPRQETLALLKIRSDMDVAFRDSSLKGPLWDEVSRKLAELGYHRSAKKCKEKFENVYKYHKRTKEGRTSKADGKTYRFFDQLQALEANPTAGSHHQQPLSLPPPQPVLSKPPPQVSTMPNTSTITQILPSVVTPVNISVSHQNNVDPISVAAPAVAMPSMNINHVGGFPFSQLNISASTNSSSSSTSSDDEPPERRRNRKRKWKEFFGRLMKEVIDKQEELQSKFLDTLERRERDRMAREEAWRIQEMAKMKREHDLLVQERSMVAAKDAAVITFLQKITEQNPSTVIPQMPAMQLLQQQQQQNQPPPPLPPPSSVQPPPPMQQQHQQQSQPPPPPPPQVLQQQQQPISPLSAVPLPAPVSLSTPAPPPPVVRNLDNGGGGENMLQPSPSRWPKAEINALIKLRTTLDTKYQESGPKGPLWEEISSAMKKLGYNRNAKRCKEKWENINKYYKKVKESSKKRPEDSKTCPYFHQLDAIYREKATSSNNNNNNNSNPAFAVKPENQMAPIMARPEQQWPLPAVVQEQHHHLQQQHHHHQQQQQQQQQQRHNQQMKTNESTGIEDHQHADDDDDYDEEDEDDDEEEGEGEGEGGEYEIVPNKTSSMAAVE